MFSRNVSCKICGIQVCPVAFGFSVKSFKNGLLITKCLILVYCKNSVVYWWMSDWWSKSIHRRSRPTHYDRSCGDENWYIFTSKWMRLNGNGLNDDDDHLCWSTKLKVIISWMTNEKHKFSYLSFQRMVQDELNLYQHSEISYLE